MMLNLKSYPSERRKAFQAWRMASMGQVTEGSGSRQGQKSESAVHLASRLHHEAKKQGETEHRKCSVI